MLASAFTAPDKSADEIITLSKIFHLQVLGGMQLIFDFFLLGQKRSLCRESIKQPAAFVNPTIFAFTGILTELNVLIWLKAKVLIKQWRRSTMGYILIAR